MKLKLLLLFSIFSFTASAQESQTVNLKWKVGKEEKLNYLTVMSDIDTSSIDMDFSALFKALSDSTKHGLKISNDIFKKFNEAFKNQDFVTTLTNKNDGIIDIVMETKPKEPIKEKASIKAGGDKDLEALKMMQAMAQGVMLRGAVYETGGIHSFWVKSAQKNLIALLFELPTKAVKTGDKWSLDVSLITNDQNFVCDTSYKTNEVSLLDLKKLGDETIAILKYNVVEYVKGKFIMPSFFGNAGGQTPSMMKFSHQAIGEFSINRGRWINYDGIMSLEATGIMTANKKTKFTLIDEQKAGK